MRIMQYLIVFSWSPDNRPGNSKCMKGTGSEICLFFFVEQLSVSPPLISYKRLKMYKLGGGHQKFKMYEARWGMQSRPKGPKMYTFLGRVPQWVYIFSRGWYILYIIYYILYIYIIYIYYIYMLAFQGVVPSIDQPIWQWTTSVLRLNSCLATSGEKSSETPTIHRIFWFWNEVS